MTAACISLHDFIDTLRQRLPYLHPAAQVTLGDYFIIMHEAAAHGDAQTVARLLRGVRSKVAQELRWQAEDAATARDYREAHRLRHQAQRWRSEAHQS